jgi:hypothetical protein
MKQQIAHILRSAENHGPSALFSTLTQNLWIKGHLHSDLTVFVEYAGTSGVIGRWEKRDAPDNCSKMNVEWVCE